jgi:hypothetical protein
MAKTQRIDDFTINIGRSSRRNIHSDTLDLAQKVVDQADIGNLTIQFERDGAALGQPVMGKFVGKKTAISVVSNKKLKKYGLEELGNNTERISDKPFWRKTRKSFKTLKKTGNQTRKFN